MDIPIKLKNFSIISSFEPIVGTEAAALLFAEEVGLIPSKASKPPICCSHPMKVEVQRSSKFGWIWRCFSRKSKKKGEKCCTKIINPSYGTFFDGNVCHIPIRDVLCMMIMFVLKFKVTDTVTHINNWRAQRGEEGISNHTVCDYYSYCLEVCEVIASHSCKPLGGEGKTVQIDETFLTKRKYHRGRLTNQMTIVVLGMYCKEDKTGVFFRVNSKSKQSLWPYIQKFVEPSTSVICTDSARQYDCVEKLFNNTTVHLTTNHSRGEFVELGNPKNTINDLENQNKLLKKAILSRRSDRILHQYMAVYFFRVNILEKEHKNDVGAQILVFFKSVKEVYPGYKDGVYTEGLFLNAIDPIDNCEIEGDCLEDDVLEEDCLLTDEY